MKRIGAVVLSLLFLTLGLAACGSPGQSLVVPSQVPHDCSVDVTSVLQQLLNSVPVGGTIVLDSNACYLVSSSPSSLLTVENTTNVTIDGNGATFKQASYVGGNQQQPVVTVGHNSGLVANNLNVVGPSPVGGAGSEGDIGILAWQNTNSTFTGVNVSNVEGDGLDLYMKGGNQPGVNTNVVFNHSNFGQLGYHAIVPEAVNGFTFENSTMSSGNIDAEVDFNCQSSWTSSGSSDCGTLTAPNVGVVNMTIQNDTFPNGLQLLGGISCMPLGNWNVLNNNFGTGGFNLQMNTTYSLTLSEFTTCGQYSGLKVTGNTSTGTSLHPCCGAGSPYVLVQGWKNVTISNNSLVFPTNGQSPVIEFWASNAAVVANTFANAPALWDSSAPTGWTPSTVTQCGNVWGTTAQPQHDASCTVGSKHVRKR